MAISKAKVLGNSILAATVAGGAVYLYQKVREAIEESNAEKKIREELNRDFAGSDLHGQHMILSQLVSMDIKHFKMVGMDDLVDTLGKIKKYLKDSEYLYEEDESAE